VVAAVRGGANDPHGGLSLCDRAVQEPEGRGAGGHLAGKAPAGDGADREAGDYGGVGAAGLWCGQGAAHCGEDTRRCGQAGRQGDDRAED